MLCCQFTLDKLFAFADACNKNHLNGARKELWSNYGQQLNPTGREKQLLAEVTAVKQRCRRIAKHVSTRHQVWGWWGRGYPSRLVFRCKKEGIVKLFLSIPVKNLFVVDSRKQIIWIVHNGKNCCEAWCRFLQKHDLNGARTELWNSLSIHVKIIIVKFFVWRCKTEGIVNLFCNCT